MLFSYTKKVVIKVGGMHCAHCKARVENAAMSVSGVKSASADLKSQSLKLAVSDDACQSVVNNVIAAVSNLGFKAEI